MAVNVTVRDIINFPGGTPKTITLDIAQIVTAGGNPEGDQIWVTSATTTATASGSVAIQSIFKNQMKRGYIRNSGLTANILNVPSNYAMKIAIDETAGSGVDITLTSGNNILLENIAQDIETKLRLAGKAPGGAKAGDLSYLNAQVRVIGGFLIIESGTVTDSFTGTGRSSVAVSAPTGLGLTDARSLLGFNIPTSSEDLAARQIAEASLSTAYSSGDLLTLDSNAGFSAGDPVEVLDGTFSDKVLVSGTISSNQIRFVTLSGTSTGLSHSYSSGALVRKLHPVDLPDPVSAVSTVDQLYRFAIDSIVNQIDFSS